MQRAHRSRPEDRCAPCDIRLG